MAANKFASMLHKNCHKITVILVYAVLEWILILLLLLNSFFSYLIAKFSNFFGLKPSCTWCSRLDHIFYPRNIANSPFDNVCEAHGAEIGKLSYCCNHKRLAESKNMCSNCSSSSPETKSEASSAVAFFTSISEGVSDGEKNSCSCCDEKLSRKDYPPSLVFKPSWDVVDYIQKTASLDLIKHKIEVEEKGREDDSDDQRASEKDGGQKREVAEVQEWNSSQTDDPFGCNEDEESVYLTDLLLQNADYTDTDKFICIELINSPSVSSQQPLTEEQGLSVEEAYDSGKIPESEEKKDYNMPVGGPILRSSSDAEFLVTNSAIIVQPEAQDTLNQDCLDGSLIGEMEVDDECLSREELKIMIKAQENALKALYAELEEERKAAEEAAKETMAMITRVQEEKAAVQIEALQYQRMMEEQAEYDQEALQLLNDLMIKREKEKKELEKELEIYRSKVLDHEERDNEDSDFDTYIDLDCEDEHDESRFGTNQEHNLDDSLEGLGEAGEECIRDVVIPDVSLAEFDEERVSILEELKILEGKLLALHDDEEKGTMKSDDHERETMYLVAKKLLPLFDDHEKETTHLVSNGIESNNSKMLMQEELGHVYERLQALEEDKDFLEHCIRSMMKGNKGLVLLQEILQHLRDLKSVELSARNLAEIPISEPSMIVEDQQ